MGEAGADSIEWQEAGATRRRYKGPEHKTHTRPTTAVGTIHRDCSCATQAWKTHLCGLWHMLRCECRRSPPPRPQTPDASVLLQRAGAKFVGEVIQSSPCRVP